VRKRPTREATKQNTAKATIEIQQHSHYLQSTTSSSSSSFPPPQKTPIQDHRGASKTIYAVFIFFFWRNRAYEDFPSM
jgi:hypothetical protein